MDDARLADEMTLDGIAKQLKAIHSDLAAVKADVSALKVDLTGVKVDLTGVKADLGSVTAGVKAGFQKADLEFNAAKIRDEELRSLAKLGLEASQGLLETTTARFDASDTKHDQEIGLLKAVLLDARSARR